MTLMDLFEWMDDFGKDAWIMSGDGEKKAEIMELRIKIRQAVECVRNKERGVSVDTFGGVKGRK